MHVGSSGWCKRWWSNIVGAVLVFFHRCQPRNANSWTKTTSFLWFSTLPPTKGDSITCTTVPHHCTLRAFSRHILTVCTETGLQTHISPLQTDLDAENIGMAGTKTKNHGVCLQHWTNQTMNSGLLFVVCHMQRLFGSINYTLETIHHWWDPKNYTQYIVIPTSTVNVSMIQSGYHTVWCCRTSPFKPGPFTLHITCHYTSHWRDVWIFQTLQLRCNVTAERVRFNCTLQFLWHTKEH